MGFDGDCPWLDGRPFLQLGGGWGDGHEGYYMKWTRRSVDSGLHMQMSKVLFICAMLLV
jgi:hypothetical protein